jgi:Icc-related predicted phosphoesterase
MKIIFASDIHEAYTNLSRLFRNTDADLYIIAGDLIYCAFSSWEKAARFTEQQQQIFSLGIRYGIKGTREDIAQALITHLPASDQDKTLADDYLKMAAESRRTMLKKYERMARIFSSSGKPRIITLPGNYDMDLAHTALAPWDLHRKSLLLNGIKISGYGGAPVFTPGIPENLQVKFNERLDNATLYSEPYQFFQQEAPDVMLVHHPAYGYLDRLAVYGSIGSIGLRDFVDQSNVRIILSGHMHEDWGAIFKQGKIFINPSNFGRVIEIKRIKRGGYFLEIQMEGKEFIGGTQRQIEGGAVFDIEKSILRNGKFRLQVIDLKRYRYLSNITRREKHIRAIRIFNRLRGFFQKYETPASSSRIEELLKITESLDTAGHEVAFHLLGSLNFGMAEETSDLDAVLYFRDQQLKAADDVSHPVPDYVQEQLAALKAQGLVVSICDCLNLAGIEQAIRREDVESLLLQRFIFYASTCRCINGRVIREVEHMLATRDWIRVKVEQELEQYFRMLISSFRHAYSFRKYQERLREKGMTVPPYIEELIWQYLQRTEKKSRRHG